MSQLKNAEIGARLRDARKFLQLKQATVAERLGVSRQIVSYIENGQQPIKAQDLITLCNLYRVTPDHILGFKETP